MRIEDFRKVREDVNLILFEQFGFGLDQLSRANRIYDKIEEEMYGQ